MTPGITLRSARAGDAPAIAALHAASWRSAYRGILSDAFLDGPVDVERPAFWLRRLETAQRDIVTILAETGGALVGFSCLILDEDPRWGSLIANLHADPACHGLGIGRLLMRETAARATLGAPDRPLYLFCLDGNLPARGFYERVGGRLVERLGIEEPDGAIHPSLRYTWSDPAALADGCV